MKISASIYSGKKPELQDLIEELDAHGVEFFHVDSIENPNVFDDIADIRKWSRTPIDLHLITSTPDKYWDLIIKNQIENVTFQFENLTAPLKIPSDYKGITGLALTSETSVDEFRTFEKFCSFVLLMTTTPGVSGGEFNQKNFKKIRKFRNLFPDKKIRVDGGINEELSFILRNMGVDTAVVGSYLFKNDYLGSALLKLKSDNIQSRYVVRDFMLDTEEIPVLDFNEINFEKVLTSIDNFKLGFTNVVNAEGKLIGIISNADIRKALMRNLSNLNAISVEGMINKTPALVKDSDTITDVLNYVKNLHFPVLFLPVIDHDGKIAGTIKFNNLIKGEL